MTPSFTVRTTPRFDRLLKALSRRHAELTERYAEALRILSDDPYNRTRCYHIKKLEGVSQGEGQYRLSLGRWRFRYDIYGRGVVLHSCSLRLEGGCTRGSHRLESGAPPHEQPSSQRLDQAAGRSEQSRQRCEYERRRGVVPLRPWERLPKP